MEAMKPLTGGVGGGNTTAEINEEMRIENIKLRSRNITLEKELQEQSLKTSKSNAKDKSNEQYVSIPSDWFTFPTSLQLLNSNQYVYLFLAV